jgi:hypothetical protein
VIDFSGKMSYLHTISLSLCQTEKDIQPTILNEIRHLIQSCLLTNLRLHRIFLQKEDNFILTLKSSLLTSNYLTKLDVLSNSIGDDGLSHLLEFLEGNIRITFINFDGSCPNDINFFRLFATNLFFFRTLFRLKSRNLILNFFITNLKRKEFQILTHFGLHQTITQLMILFFF